MCRRCCSLPLFNHVEFNRSRFAGCGGVLAILVCVLMSLAQASEPSIVVLPSTIQLDFRGAFQSLIVQSVAAEGVLGLQITSGIDFFSSDETVATVSNGQVFAVGTGETTIRVTSALGSASVPVTVRFGDSPKPWEFENHVQSVLARQGCNSGACHGALAGKGGFRLSLRGYDADADHFNITRADRSRRVELLEPGQSLLLLKPSGLLPHKGGLRLSANSPDFQVVADWLADGAPRKRLEEPRLTSVEPLPRRVRLGTGDEQQLVVLAHFDNGRIEDVTSWCKFSSSDESIALVDERGTMQVVGPGVGAIIVWYASRVELVEVVVPFSEPVGDLTRLPIANLIDAAVAEQLTQLGLTASERCSDETFLRRAYLDTIGLLPNESEIEQFRLDRSPDKRSRLVEGLLNRPEFVDYWTYRWSDVLMLNGTLLLPEALKSYYLWIRSHVERNTPWDQMVREIVVARGDSFENGATNFYALFQDPENMTENTSQAFLGLSIGCARCHNHPLEKWTNDQYYAMAGMFARVRAKGWGGDGREGDGRRSIVTSERGELIQPSTGRPQLPAPLDADPIDPESKQDRRESLASWLTSPENPYFTKAVVNRVWANFFGIGIINPVDDLRVSNPPSNKRLLEALSQYLIDHQYDLKSLMRLILLSETYQRSSGPVPGNQGDKKYFSRYYPKRLMAEVLHDSVCQVTGVPSKFTEIEFPGADKRATNFYAEGTRATQLYDSAVANYFLKTFGRNQRRIVCECERSDEPTIVQVLHLSNGETLNAKLAQSGNVVDHLLTEYSEFNAELVKRAYRMCFARDPTDREVAEVIQASFEDSAVPLRQLIEDLLWSLMTSREFLFNH